MRGLELREGSLLLDSGAADLIAFAASVLDHASRQQWLACTVPARRTVPMSLQRLSRVSMRERWRACSARPQDSARGVSKVRGARAWLSLRAAVPRSACLSLACASHVYRTAKVLPWHRRGVGRNDRSSVSVVSCSVRARVGVCVCVCVCVCLCCVVLCCVVSCRVVSCGVVLCVCAASAVGLGEDDVMCPRASACSWAAAALHSCGWGQYKNSADVNIDISSSGKSPGGWDA